MKKQLLDNSIIQLEELIESYNQPKYRAKQLYAWLLLGKDYSEMSNLPKDFLLELQAEYTSKSVSILKKQVSKDGTKKYLFQLQDGATVESVFLPNKYGNTICVSSQVGCKFDCKFCASALAGFSRNCSAGEILSQLIYVNVDNGGTIQKRAIGNIVLMGSGEPLDNFDNIVKFLQLVVDERGLNFSNRNISVSTCGLVDKIKQLANLNLGITLSISLHATTDESRQQIMPIAKVYSIKQVVEAAKYYFEKTGRRVAFEYIMIKGLNTNYLDATRLAEISKQLSSHVNLIPLNWVTERSLQGITKQEARRFCDRLNSLGVSATIRRTQGDDIDGACGQLRNKLELKY
ncbi:MAG: 23S rRNA (adenine(2503)-C(2))-methyltransferase RlmN [Firmicutes bacterium]|nr:23S rRNA (adenine(2503)-C(2))-methyltransferase RlmN [Bacillota bacterium]MCL1953809.1 23S rRNA (adenine(2503)-C(2))-methyltransferase RlmN [Bacillota bacterium]